MASNSPAATPAVIPPPYPLPNGREPIVLYRGLLELRDSAGASLMADGRIELQLTPSLKFRFVMGSHHELMHPGGPATLVIADLGANAPVFVTDVKNGTAGAEVVGTIETSNAGSSSEIVETRFLVANLPDFLGERIHEDRGAPLGQLWAGRLHLAGAGWLITLDQRPDFRAAYDRLDELHGFDITHMGMLRRADGRSFSDSDAEAVLDALANFLGFAAGAWAPPVAAIGLDHRGDVVWREWKARFTSPWRTRLYAFDHHKHDLGGAFEGYLERWFNPTWSETLGIATHMYTEANGPLSVDSSLVIGQAILEHLAKTLFVDDLQRYSAEEFDNPRRQASGRIRELLDWVEVDPAIPASLGALHQEAAGRWDDGPHAMVEMRNSLPHPRRLRRLTGTPSRARIELQELALWYVELALLRLIDYRGGYMNRLGTKVKGVVDDVPWR